MSSRITQRLRVYFATALIAFAVAAAIIFFVLFRTQTIDVQKIELLRRATVMSETLSGIEATTANGTQGSRTMGGMAGQGGYGAFLRFLGAIAGVEAWVVDSNLSLVSFGGAPAASTSGSLPVSLASQAQAALKGQTTSKEISSGFFDEPTLVASAPVTNSNGTITGAIVLRTTTATTQDAFTSGLWLLAISLGVALALAIMLAARFSLTFTKPLMIMNTTANTLAKGDYSVETGIQQADEIGELAHSLDSLAASLDDAQQKTEALNQMRNDFVANISHELRTPITVMRGSVEAIVDKVVSSPEKVELYHKQILNETIHLERLVDDLLDLSKLQSTEFTIHLDDVSLAQVADDAQRTAELLAQSKSITIVRTGNAPEHIKGDYDRLRQLLLILLDNAIKYSPQGSMVTLALSDKDIRISDRGPGITAADIELIFDRFQRTRFEDGKSGSGLGLAIGKQIANRHRMKLYAQSDGQSGSTFVVELPHN